MTPSSDPSTAVAGPAVAPGRAGDAGAVIRTLHHMACTGGTVIAKCIAALPNVRLLSEIDPLSPFPATGGEPRFAPTDMITQLRQSTRGTDQEEILELFLEDLRRIHDRTRRRGQRLVLRDHAHSHFCHGAAVPDRPDLRRIVAAAAPVRSLLTVRHPVDSFASLVRNRWVHFSPPDFDTYCGRYLAFLDTYADLPCVRYEDFVAAPQTTMASICDHLDLAYGDDFVELFGLFRLSGDSGRASERLERPARRPEALALAPQCRSSQAYAELVGRLGYAPDPAAAMTN